MKLYLIITIIAICIYLYMANSLKEAVNTLKLNPTNYENTINNI